MPGTSGDPWGGNKSTAYRQGCFSTVHSKTKQMRANRTISGLFPTSLRYVLLSDWPFGEPAHIGYDEITDKNTS